MIQVAVQSIKVLCSNRLDTSEKLMHTETIATLQKLFKLIEVELVSTGLEQSDWKASSEHTV